MEYKHRITLIIVYLLVSLAMVFMIGRLGTMKYDINRKKHMFNDDLAFLHLPEEQEINFVLENYNESVNVYALKELQINNNLNYVYEVATLKDFTVYNYYYGWAAFTTDDELLEGEIYSTGTEIKGTTFKPLNFTKTMDEEGSAFLYSKVNYSDIDFSDIYLIVFEVDSVIYDEFIHHFKEPNTTVSNMDYEFFVLGSVLFDYSTSIIFQLIRFAFVMHIIPLILIVFLVKYTYEVFLASEMKAMHIRHIFYQSKRSIWLKLALNNSLIFMITNGLLSLIYGVIFGFYLETIKYLTYLSVFMVFVIVISSYSVVKKATNSVMNKVV